MKIAAIALLAVATCCSQAWADEAPLQIAQQGFFYVGGQRSSDGAGIIDQMFVEYQVPVQKTAPYPIVMIHGGSLPQRGIHGNGHMMMIEKNNSDIAALIAGWADQLGK